MKLKNLVLTVGPVLLLLAGSSCFSTGGNDDDDDCDGEQGCACFGNGTCNSGLACQNDVCVNPGSGSGGTSGVDIAACLECGEGACPDESADCDGTDGCNELIDCLLGCGTNDTACAQNCQGSYSAAALTAAQAFALCSYTECLNECVATGTGGTSGTGGTAGNGSGGTVSSGGTAGSSAGGSNAGGSSGSSSGGTGGTVLSPGVNWLVLEGNVALETAEPNGSLGINGVLYGFTDGCATMTWDPVTRCASGNLCAWSATNWGVAVGFDFYNTGETGDPANTKYPWNATAVNATGVAWSVTNTSYETMSVWLTNMDPSFAGVCAADDCGIAGPPDGTSAASTSGQMLFSSMVKEDWGGSGTIYTFDPTNILALQFKLPGASTTETAYTLCVNDIGIIR